MYPTHIIRSKIFMVLIGYILFFASASNNSRGFPLRALKFGCRARNASVAVVNLLQASSDNARRQNPEPSR